MKESTLKTRIKRDLTRLGCKVIAYPNTGLGEKGTPDLIGCYRGQMFLIEAKVGDNDPSKIQYRRLDEWNEAGAFADVEREDFDAEDFLLRLIKARTAC